MSENTPPSVPGGSVPPKPPEPAKVQPKKETVRISLPPKPTAAPTIKLPSVPAAGPAAAGAPAAPAATPAPPAPPRPATSAPPSGGAPAAPAAAQRPATGTGAAAPRPPAPAPAPRPAAPAAKKVSGLDVGLSIAAAVIALGAVASVALLLNLK